MDATDGRYHWPFKLDQVASRVMVQKGGSSGYLAANSPRDEADRMLSIDNLFKGRHFDQEIIILCVRW
jgi:hypothetical protein